MRSIASPNSWSSLHSWMDICMQSIAFPNSWSNIPDQWIPNPAKKTYNVWQPPPLFFYLRLWKQLPPISRLFWLIATKATSKNLLSSQLQQDSAFPFSSTSTITDYLSFLKSRKQQEWKETDQHAHPTKGSLVLVEHKYGSLPFPTLKASFILNCIEILRGRDSTGYHLKP